VDLAVKFGLPPCTVSRHTCIIIVEIDLAGQPTAMGIMADSVNQVIDLRPEDIEPPPAFGTRVRVDFLLGMVGAARKFLLLLDLDRVLSMDEILAATTVAAEESEEAAAPADSAEDAAAGITEAQTPELIPVDASESAGSTGIDLAPTLPETESAAGDDES
jgi:purine-binding chemotaxis protein CheW